MCKEGKGHVAEGAPRSRKQIIGPAQPKVLFNRKIENQKEQRKRKATG